MNKKRAPRRFGQFWREKRKTKHLEIINLFVTKQVLMKPLLKPARKKPKNAKRWRLTMSAKCEILKLLCMEKYFLSILLKIFGHFFLVAIIVLGITSRSSWVKIAFASQSRNFDFFGHKLEGFFISLDKTEIINYSR